MGSSFMEMLDFWVHEWILLCVEMELSLGKASVEFGSVPDVQAEKYVAAMRVTALSEGNTILYRFPQCEIQLASRPHQNGSCI